MKLEKSAKFLVIRDITGAELRMPLIDGDAAIVDFLPHRKVCHNTLIFKLMAEEKAKKKRK